MARLGIKQVASSTSGSVLFTDSNHSIAENNQKFFWDNANERLGIGTNTPGYTLEINGSAGYTTIPTLTLDTEFVHKKYVDDLVNIVGVPHIQSGTTGDSTQYTLLDSLTIDSNTRISFDINIIAYNVANQDSWNRKYTGFIKNNGGVTSIVGSVTEEYIGEDINTSSWSVIIEANNTSDAIDIKVTGQTSTTIVWKSKMIYNLL